MKNTSDSEFNVTAVVFPSSFRKDMSRLCRNRHDLPLRASVGRVRGTKLCVERLLTYPEHVATLALISSGIFRQDAALMVATKNAGAFQGTVEQFDAWRTRVKLEGDRILGTTLPDDSQWVIWKTDRPLKTDLIGMVNGWAGGQMRGLDDVLDVDGTPVSLTRH